MPNTFTIFLSHKQSEQSVAALIKRELERSAPALEVLTSVGIGNPLQAAIHDNLRKANWLILLYTDPNEQWDWCLYETGFFAGINPEDDRSRRLICIYQKDLTMPGPVGNWRGIPAEGNHVLDFLKDLYAQELPNGEKLGSRIIEDESALKEMAQKIISAITPFHKGQAKPFPYLPSVTLLFEESQIQDIKGGAPIPPNTQVECGNDPLRLFNKNPKPDPSSPWTWEELIGQLKTPLEIAWLSELRRTLQNAVSDNNFKPGLPLFPSKDQNKIFRPILYQFVRTREGKKGYSIGFAEIPPAEDFLSSILNVPNAVTLGKIIAMNLVGVKFRWVIIEKYLNEFLRIHPNEDEVRNTKLQELGADLFKEIEEIENDSIRYGIRGPQDTLALFNSQEERDLLMEAENDWNGAKEQLRAAIQARNIDDALQVLQDMRNLNEKFLGPVVKRYAELMVEQFAQR